MNMPAKIVPTGLFFNLIDLLTEYYLNVADLGIFVSPLQKRLLTNEKTYDAYNINDTLPTIVLTIIKTEK